MGQQAMILTMGFNNFSLVSDAPEAEQLAGRNITSKGAENRLLHTRNGVCRGVRVGPEADATVSPVHQFADAAGSQVAQKVCELEFLAWGHMMETHVLVYEC
eukprot:3004380-Amphidinium_carterae.1